MHILLRYADKWIDSGTTIERHAEVICEKGAVLFGKFGKPIANSKVNRFNYQISNDIPTYVFLVKSTSGKRKSINIGNIIKVQRQVEPADLAKVPKYYRDNIDSIDTWLKLDHISEVDAHILDEIRVYNTGNKAIDAIHYSMAGLFYVKFRPGMSLESYRPVKVYYKG